MVARFIIAAALVAAAGLYAAELRTTGPVEARIPRLEQLPVKLDGWRGEDFPVSGATAEVLGADATLHRRFRRNDGTDVWFFVAYFSRQQTNSQIHSPRNCLLGAGWEAGSIEHRTLRVNGSLRPATRMVIERKRDAQEVLYWFQTRSGITGGEYALKWDLVKSSLKRQPTNAAFVRFNARSADSTATRELIALLEPDLERMLGEVGLR